MAAERSNESGRRSFLLSAGSLPDQVLVFSGVEAPPKRGRPGAGK